MIGNFASSKAGHDKEQIYVIADCDDHYVWLCDGRTRTLSNLKKKNSRHVQIINQTVEPQLLHRLQKKETVFDEQIKYAIKQYSNRKGKKPEDI